MKTVAYTNVDALREALMSAVKCSAADLEEAVGSVLVATAADFEERQQFSGRSAYDPATRAMVLLADRIPKGLEVPAIVAEMQRHHGREVAEKIVGVLPEPQPLQAGDKVFVRSELRLATVLNVYGDGLQGDNGDIRLDLCGNTSLDEIEPYDPELHAVYDSTFVPIKPEWKESYGITQEVPLRSLDEEPGIKAVLTRQDGESIAEFKQRCCDVMNAVGDLSAGSGAIGRYTIHPDGWLKNDIAWGQGWLNELPADTCVIARHVGVNRSGILRYTEEQLAAAPKNPGLGDVDMNPLIKVELRDADGAVEEVEFRASEVLKHNGETRSWAEVGRDPSHQHLQMSLAEDYALYAFKRQHGDMEPYEANVLEGLSAQEEELDADALPALVDASQFHSMRGHVAEGVRVKFASGEELNVRSAMRGWKLESDDGKVSLGPFDGAMSLTAAIVLRDGTAVPSVGRDDTPALSF